VLEIAELPEFAADWFVDGAARFLDGAAAGMVVPVRREEALPGRRRFYLWSAPGFEPAPGDTLRIEAGCDKRFQTCRLKFLNQQNFQGFPHIPSEDWLQATPRIDGPNTGGSLTHG